MGSSALFAEPYESVRELGAGATSVSKLSDEEPEWLRVAGDPQGPCIHRLEADVADERCGHLLSARVVAAVHQTGPRRAAARLEDGEQYLLAAGETTVRDLANDVDELLARKKRIEDGTEIGTRIVMAGFMDGPGPYQGPTKVLVAEEKSGREWIDKYAALGMVQLKLYSSLKPELVAPLAEAAHKKGLRVSGHIPAGLTASDAVKLGYDEIQHANFLVLNFMPDVKETRTPARFNEPAGDPAARISDVRKAVVTVKAGLVYRPAELYGELGVKP